MIKWIKKLRQIVAAHKELMHVVGSYDANQARLQRQTLTAINLIRKRTQIHTDIHFRDTPNQIIVVGRYRNHDYVKVYSVLNDDMRHLVDMLKEMQKGGVIRTIDAPPGISAVIHDELRW